MKLPELDEIQPYFKDIRLHNEIVAAMLTMAYCSADDLNIEDDISFVYKSFLNKLNTGEI